MNISKPWMKVIFIIVLLLIILPLVLFAIIQFTLPVQDQPGTADNSDSRSTTTRERRAKRETRIVRQETTVMETEPEQNFEGVGAVVPNAPRSKQMTPYEPGTVPGDSGIVPQLAEPPDFVDEVSPDLVPFGDGNLNLMRDEKLTDVPFDETGLAFENENMAILNLALPAIVYYFTGDDGDCLVGDLEPMEYLSAYGDNPALKADWNAILNFHPKRILYSHVNEKG